jgi:hypothetical protein
MWGGRVVGRWEKRMVVRVLGREVGDGAAGVVVDERPRSVYEVMTRRMLEELKREVGEVKGRVNTLLWMVAGAIVLDVVVRLTR